MRLCRYEGRVVVRRSEKWLNSLSGISSVLDLHVSSNSSNMRVN